MAQLLRPFNMLKPCEVLVYGGIFIKFANKMIILCFASWTSSQG